MTVVLEYRGRRVTQPEVEFIRELIAAHPTVSRRGLSKQLCQAWGWMQPNGALRDMVCRGLMLELHRAGHIQLPPVRFVPPNPLARSRRPPARNVEVEPIPVRGSLPELGELSFRQVRRTPDEPLVASLLQQHHYLGYRQPVGEHLKYIVFAGKRPIGCLAWSSAPRHIGCRDRFIGWDADSRRNHIHLMAYNTRFLVLPWVRVSHLASHILGQIARVLPADWQRIYHHPVYYLETFVDKERFKGSCYKAANWIYLGDTTGRGKNDQTNKSNRSIKAVFGYPLTSDFRKHLCGAL